MSTEAEINSIEQNIKDASGAKALGNSLERLLSNRDFRAVIQQGYFTDEAVRLVHAKGNPACQSEDKQASIIKAIDSISMLNQFLNTIKHNAMLANKAIDEGEAMLEELRSEELQ